MARMTYASGSAVRASIRAAQTCLFQAWAQLWCDVQYWVLRSCRTRRRKLCQHAFHCSNCISAAEGKLLERSSTVFHAFNAAPDGIHVHLWFP